MHPLIEVAKSWWPLECMIRCPSVLCIWKRKIAKKSEMDSMNLCLINLSKQDTLLEVPHVQSEDNALAFQVPHTFCIIKASKHLFGTPQYPNLPGYDQKRWYQSYGSNQTKPRYTYQISLRIDSHSIWGLVASLARLSVRLSQKPI